jgi:hypothetical protein
MIAEETRMNCAQFAEAVNRLDRAYTQVMPESALAHAESCGECARLLLEKLFESRPVPAGGRAIHE